MNSWDPNLLLSVLHIIHGKYSWAMRLIHRGKAGVTFCFTVAKIMSGEQVSRYHCYLYIFNYYFEASHYKDTILPYNWFLLKDLQFLLRTTLHKNTYYGVFQYGRSWPLISVNDFEWLNGTVWQFETSIFKLTFLFVLPLRKIRAGHLPQFKAKYRMLSQIVLMVFVILCNSILTWWRHWMVDEISGYVGALWLLTHPCSGVHIWVRKLDYHWLG